MVIKSSFKAIYEVFNQCKECASRTADTKSKLSTASYYGECKHRRLRRQNDNNLYNLQYKWRHPVENK